VKLLFADFVIILLVLLLLTLNNITESLIFEPILTGKYSDRIMASSNGIRPNAWVILRLASDQMKAVEVKPNT
jgi:hypothetical protein